MRRVTFEVRRFRACEQDVHENCYTAQSPANALPYVTMNGVNLFNATTGLVIQVCSCECHDS